MASDLLAMAKQYVPLVISLQAKHMHAHVYSSDQSLRNCLPLTMHAMLSCQLDIAPNGMHDCVIGVE